MDLLKKNGHLCVALGPKRLFIATNNFETYQEIVSVGSDKLAKTFNDRVVRQAVQNVYGSNDAQLRFVENRLRNVTSEKPAAIDRSDK